MFYPYWPWCRCIHYFIHKTCLLHRYQSLFFPGSCELNPPICKYRVHCSWICLTTFPFDILTTPDSYHLGSVLNLLLNLLIFPLINSQVHLVWAFSVDVEPVRMIYGGLLHPKHSRLALTLYVAILMASLNTLVHTYPISHLVLSVPVREINDGSLWSIQADVSSDPWIYPPKSTSPIGACYPGFS